MNDNEIKQSAGTQPAPALSAASRKAEPAPALSAASRKAEPASALSAASRSPLPKTAPRLTPEKQAALNPAPNAAPGAAEPEEPAPELPPDPNERVTVCDVQFRSGSKIYFFDPAGLTLKPGDHVVIDTARGAEYGNVVVGNHKVLRRNLVQPLRPVLRVASPQDERIREENAQREKKAYEFCQKKVEELGLDMQLVSAECAFDGSKLLFFFTADARVDFRELVKILASNLHARIELRQIGVRDKAKMLGGLGICGRPFCCAQFLDDFQPVSIKMAKTQNLSLNPTKISGTCGRLMCCLKYEQDAYEDLIQSSPKPESFVDTPDGRGTVTAVNLMRQSVSVRMEKDPEEIHSYRNSEICVLRQGKARKNDPPIPEDLAPISGGEKPAAQPRYESRLTVDEPEPEPAPWEEELPESEEPKAERRRSRRERRGKSDAEPEAPAEASAEELPAEKPEAPAQRPQEGGQGRRGGKKRPERRKGEEKKPEPRPEERRPEESRPAEKPEKADKAERPEKGEKPEEGRPHRSRAERRADARQRPEQRKKDFPKGEDNPQLQKAEAKAENARKNARKRYYHRRPKQS